MRGILPHVTQEELNSKKAHIETGGSEKEALMEGDTKPRNLTRLSIGALFLLYDPLQLF